MTNRHIVNRALPERSYLKFYFPSGKDNKFMTVRLPFFENPTIKESKRARYKKHSLISRSSNLYTYHGADSRMFNLSFNITTPHLLQEHGPLKVENFAWGENYQSLGYLKLLFKKKTSDTPANRASTLAKEYRNMDLVSDSARQALNNSPFGLQGITFEEADALEKEYAVKSTANAMLESESAFTRTIGAGLAANYGSTAETREDYFSAYETDETKAKMNTLNVVNYFVNLVRSSVVNNAENPLLGPPIIRILHGLLYRDIPCICTDYTIGYDEAAGYDVQTLLPRKITITMKLEEFRAGDYGKFDSSQVIGRDNLAGWEAVISSPNKSMEPDNIYSV
jgi:hypothetical protein